MKRFIAIIVLLAMMVAAFAGCSQRGQENSTAPSDGQENLQPVVPEDYASLIKTGGNIEARYYADGTEAVTADHQNKDYLICYPSELIYSKEVYPAVIFLNGEGVGAERYEQLLRHFASWGLIAIGMKASTAGTAEIADHLLDTLLGWHEDEASLFCGKIDEKHIGLIGYAEGASAVLDAVTTGVNAKSFAAAVIVMPMIGEGSGRIMLPAKGKIKNQAPVLILAGAQNDVTTQKTYEALYDCLEGGKLLMCRKNTTAEQMYYAANGYITAWFQYMLQEDKKTELAFGGTAPEYKENTLYEMQKDNLVEWAIGKLLELLVSVPMVPEDYTDTVMTAGSIEAKYLAMGSYETSYTEAVAPEGWGKFTAYYPKEMESSSKRYPVVVFVNGTGVYSSRYPALFKHLASWGFIVIGNEDPSTCTGASADATLEWLLEESENKSSIFYGKVDINNIGISGHSQGGVGVFNAVTVQENSGLYKTAVALSPTYEEGANLLGMPYDISKVTIPTLMVAGTDGDFETVSVIPLEEMLKMYDRLGAPKVMLRRIGSEHGETLYEADGYVTAWFMWQLQGDQEAAKAFVGSSPEMMTNPQYQDQQSALHE